MRILFLCTAHNSLSQRLFLELKDHHSVTIEYALSAEIMIEATSLANPDLILCPFLTTRIPSQIYENYMTLIVHPGPPGDAGPSSIDWLLMGDDGEEPSDHRLLSRRVWSKSGRSHWGVTILQAAEDLDAGPVWAFDQFTIDIDARNATKSSVYRGPVTRAAVNATLKAIERLQTASRGGDAQCLLPGPGKKENSNQKRISCEMLRPDLEFRNKCVTRQQHFLGGATFRRPLLRASDRRLNWKTHTAKDISRRIRSADTQPGSLTDVFGTDLYVYGGLVEGTRVFDRQGSLPGAFLAIQHEAVLLATEDGQGVWITHIRRLKQKEDRMLWPKEPAVLGLQALNLLEGLRQPVSPAVRRHLAQHATFEEVRVNFHHFPDGQRMALLYFDFYNGAMGTSQCARLLDALHAILASHQPESPLSALILMGGSGYFSNGIALNVIEAAKNPSQESWCNINRMNDVVECILRDFASRNIFTAAAVRGNCAAGGVALAAACDHVIAASDVVINPAYRGLGLHGSEFHSISYPGRCGSKGAKTILRDMKPLSALDAQRLGLIDEVWLGPGQELDEQAPKIVQTIVISGHSSSGTWKAGLSVSSAVLSRARTEELGEMAKDFWSVRAKRYHGRRRDFVRKRKPARTPLRFAEHRRGPGMRDEEETSDFDMPLGEDSKTSKALGGVAEVQDSEMKEWEPVFACHYKTFG